MTETQQLPKKNTQLPGGRPRLMVAPYFAVTSANDNDVTRQCSVRVPTVALLILGLFCFAPQFYFGFVGSGLLTPLGWSLGMAMFAVGTGWRAPQKGIPASVLIGTCYAAAVNLPIYLIGRWLGDPTSTSVAFTAIASVLGLLTFGSLTLVRRIWPQQPGHEKAPPPVRVIAFHQRSGTSFRKSIA